jgi:hypothetical protein
MNAKSRKKTFNIRQTYDVDEVIKLHKKLFPLDDWYDSRYPAVYWLVYDSKGNPVGFSILGLLPDDVCFLARSGVLWEARGNGLQVRMIRVREMYARKYNFTKVITYTKIDNIASSHNLQKAGYYLYLPETPYADDDCLYWIKEV